MTTPRLIVTLTLAASIATAAIAESHDPADYPLRVHIYQLQTHSHSYRGVVSYVEGEGRGNLFAEGQPEGIDFAFHCGERFMTSSGWETYPAKWKKPGKSLVVLLRRIGSDSTDTCELKVDVKDFAYVRRNGTLTTEPTAVFRQWMTAHQYDPEHGLNEPVQPASPTPPQP